jgi:crotonobetainyl-CoA:carnitine CoA-transferase CaiB-like acyl-CoA transferase
VSETLLEGVRVVELAGEPAALGGRILADLGAEVVKVEPPGGDPLRGAPPFLGERRDPEASLRFAAWNAGKKSLCCEAGDPRLAALLAAADVVIETPGWPGVLSLDPERAPQSVWVRVTPFGLAGPRAGWRASDLGVLAASGNMYATGFPDSPVRCTEPSGYAHVGPDVAFAALAGLASGRPQLVDLSMQETVMVANMTGAGKFPRTRNRGRRGGAQVGRTREIWRCRDGYVSFGLRGGRARVPSLRIIEGMLEEEGLATPAWSGRDWERYDPDELSDAELRRLEEPVAALFARHTMLELFEKACETNLMLASANSPREIYASAQAAAREMFGKLGELDGFPLRICLVSSADDEVEPVRARAPAPRLGSGPWPAWEPRRAGARRGRGPAFEGLRVVEFGAGAAGPIAARYFAEHGATVVKVESKSRPEFLRMMAAKSPEGLEGSPIFDALNAGKKSVALNLKHPDGVAVAKRLVHWADAVLENFAPKAMRGFGLDYETLSAEKPDLVMISTCLYGQTGPHRNYPGFGGQGSALSGFNYLTGWPDGEPIGPFGTITDSLAPRFAAAALAAGLHYRRRTGRGVYLDLSQVEVAQFALSPWLLDFANNGAIGARMGNRSPRAVPHGAFPCRGEDRWVAIAAWSDAEWERLARLLGHGDPSLAGLEARLARVDEVEAAVARFTRERSREEVARALQAEGIEAVPVLDFGDLFEDEAQLRARGHFQVLPHAVLGESHYERNGFRLSDAPGGYPGPSPALGQHTREVLRDVLGLSEAELARLEQGGGVE